MWKKEEEALPTDAMSTIVKARAFRGGLFLGGIKSAKDFPLLKSERVTAVLTVANDVCTCYLLLKLSTTKERIFDICTSRSRTLSLRISPNTSTRPLSSSTKN